MAKHARNAGRRTLTDTTVHTPVTETAVTKQDNMLPVTEQMKSVLAECKKEVRAALKSMETATNMAASAVQHFAHAIMIDHESRQLFGDNMVPTLNELRTNETKNREYMGTLMQAYCDPMPDKPETNVTDEGYLQGMKRYNAERACVKRGLDLMLWLKSHEVHSNAFDTKSGIFTVPVAAIVPDNHTPAFGLNHVDTVQLNGAPYTLATSNAEGREVYRSIRASVDQVKTVHAPPKKEKKKDTNTTSAGTGTPNTTSDGPANPQFTAAEIAKAIVDKPFNELILLTYRAFERNRVNGKLTIGDFNPTEWDAFKSLAMAWQRMDAEATVKPAAKGNGKTKAA